jgi:hypothetical protein
MTGMTKSAVQAEPTLPTTVGFIDAIAGQTIHGWAWDRRMPSERLTIHVRIGDEEIGTTTADQEREDLRDGKVGDGKHAFAFRLPADREADFDRVEILAATGNGAMTRLAMPVVKGGAAANGVGNVPDLLGRLVHSHRLLHRNLQSGLAELKDSATPANFEQLRSVQEELREQLIGIEIAVVRLDAIAQALSAAPLVAKRSAREPATVALLVLVTIFAGGSFALELLRLIL